MSSKFIRPLQVRISDQIVANLLPHQRSKRRTISTTIMGAGKKDKGTPNKHAPSEYPTCPESYKTDPATKAFFEAMKIYFHQCSHTFSEEIKQDWHNLVANHLTIPPDLRRVSMHPIYRQANKKPTWAHVVALRYLYAFIYLKKSPMYNRLQMAFPYSDLNTNKYNEDLAHSNTAKIISNPNQKSTMIEGPARKNASIVRPTCFADEEYFKNGMKSIDKGQPGNHPEVSRSIIQEQGISENAFAQKLLSMMESSTEKMIEEMKDKFSDSQIKFELKLDTVDTEAKKCVKLIMGQAKATELLQKEVASLQEEFGQVQRLTSQSEVNVVKEVHGHVVKELGLCLVSEQMCMVGRDW